MKNFIERLENLKDVNPLNNFEEGFNKGVNASIQIYNELHPQPETIAPEPNKAENLPSL